MTKKKSARIEPSAEPPLRWKRDEHGVLNAVFDDGPAPGTVDQQLADWLAAPGNPAVDADRHARAIRDAYTAEEHRRKLTDQRANARKAAAKLGTTRRKAASKKDAALLKFVHERQARYPDEADRDTALAWLKKHDKNWPIYDADDRARKLRSRTNQISKVRRKHGGRKQKP